MSNWDGSERRQQISNEVALFDRRISLLEENQNKIGEITSSLAVLNSLTNNTDKKMDEIRIDVSELKRSFNSLDKTTCSMVTNVEKRISDLPCKERSGWYSSIKNQINALWIFTTAIILIIVTNYFAKR